MSQSYVPFNDNLSASRNFHTNQRSNGSVTVEQYVQQIAEPYLATYRVSTPTAVALSTANSHLLQIMAGASLRVGIKRILVWQAANATAIGLQQLALVRLSTAGTGGTAITPAPQDPADAASGAAAMTLPTVKGTEGTTIDYRMAMVHTTAATAGLVLIADFDFQQERQKALWIAAGTANGVALKLLSSDAAGTVRIVAVLNESAEGA